MNRLRFNLNGEWVEESALAPTTTLLRYLRDVRGLTGTKEGCAEGDCGACTVALVERDASGRPVFRAVNACLLFLPMLQGKHVFTVEALYTDSAHPAQLALAEALGSQCGYCTPGVVMSMFEATYRADLDAPWKLDDQLAGNLCRCTGYRPIRDAAQKVAGTQPHDAFQVLLPRAGPTSMALGYQGEGQSFATPVTLAQLWDALEAHPDVRVIAGGTDLALEVTKRHAKLSRLVSLEGLEALKALTETSTAFVIGAGVTVAELEDYTATRLPPVHRMTRYFGARQIKHRATVGGNLCNASPIGDLAPVLVSLNATAVLQSRGGLRRVPLEDFFVAYRKTVLQRAEVLVAVEVPKLAAGARAVSYKVSKRRELDISTVSAGLFVTVDERQLVTQARLAFGGMAATVKRATAVESALLGQVWSRESVQRAAASLEKDFTPLTDSRGSAPYRMLVAKNLLTGFFDETVVTRVPNLRHGHTATVQRADEVAHA